MSEPEQADATEAARRTRIVRIGILAFVLAVVVASIVIGIVRTTHPRIRIAPRDAGTGALHAPKPPQLPAAGTRLAGMVVDGAGVPVAGAQVIADVEAGVVDRALAAAPRDGGVIDAGPSAPVASGADGRYVIDGLEPGRYRLRVTGTGLLAAEVRMVPVPSDETRIVVARRVSIEGVVTDSGKPVPGATVGIRGDPIGGTLELKADPKGAFAVKDLPEGRYQVFAWQAAVAARAVRVARLGAGPFTPVELRLEAASIVVGRVIDRDEGTGLVAAIELRPVGDDQAPRYARSGDDGVFRIEGVPNGRWIADAFSPGYNSPGGVELDAGHGVPELALVRGGTVEGRVLDADGKPVAGATVRALTVGENPVEISAHVDDDHLRRFSGRTAAPVQEATSVSADPQFVQRGELGVMLGPIPPIPPPGTIAARPAAIVDPSSAAAALAGPPPPLAVDAATASIWVTGTDGRYRIRGLAKGKLAVLAAAAGYAEARSKEVAIKTSEVATGIDIVLSAGTFVVGRVSDARGAPVVGAQVLAKPDVGAALSGFSDADGMYRVGPVAGKVELVASAYGHVEAHRVVELAPPKSKTAGEHREDLVLDAADGILAGTLDDVTGAPIAGATIEIVGGGGEGRTGTTGADGTFAIDMLPKGKLRVRVTHPDYPPDELDATASSTGVRSRLRLALGGQIEGVLLDGASGAPVAGMTVDGKGPGAATAEATSDAKGLWKLGPLRPGKWKLEVKLPGFLAQTRDVDVPVSRAPGATSVRDVRIDLERGALVGGTVRNSRGQRAGGAHITVRRVDGSGAPVEADADAQGEFRIHDCLTGELIVSATFGDASGSAHASVRPGAEVIGLSIEVR